MHKLLFYTFIVLLCGISFIAKAQYAGGSGVGFKSQSVTASFCSAPLNTNIYFGGSAEGFAFKPLIASVCTPPLNASIYFGDDKRPGRLNSRKLSPLPSPNPINASIKAIDERFGIRLGSFAQKVEK